MGMALFGSRDNLAFQITQRCKERDGAVADIIMGLGASVTLLQRKGALCALQSLALTLLVATEHQSPFGRIQIEPDDVQNFSSKFGSLEILKVSSRCGFISFWLQTRCTVLLLTLASRAIERTLHRTRPCAGRVALSTIKETLSAGSRALRPLPTASLRPAIP